MSSNVQIAASTSAGARPDARALLQSEHRTLTKLFAQFARARSPALKKAIVDEICRALTVQVQLEEEILYPALNRIPGDKDFLARAHLEQAYLLGLIAEVQGTEPDDEFDANVELISTEVLRRFQARDEGLARARSSVRSLQHLGAKLACRKKEILASMGSFGGWD